MHRVSPSPASRQSASTERRIEAIALHGVTHSDGGAGGPDSVCDSADFDPAEVVASAGVGMDACGGTAMGGGGGAADGGVTAGPPLARDSEVESGTPSTRRHRSMSTTASSIVFGVGPSGWNIGACGLEPLRAPAAHPTAEATDAASAQRARRVWKVMCEEGGASDAVVCKDNGGRATTLHRGKASESSGDSVYRFA
jgi:hypothetical protein